MEKNPIKNIVEKIKAEHIVPESRFKLNWKSYLFWLIWAVTALLGALSLSFIILNFLDLDPRTLGHLKLGRVIFTIVSTAPYLWIFLALLALFSGLLAIRQTKRGYRYNLLFLTSIGVLIISILGVTLHLTRINDHLGRRMPMGRGMMFPFENRWSHPEERMLGGEITEVKENSFLLSDFREKIWEVGYSSETEMKLEGKLQVGLKVGVVGERGEEGKFQADFIRELPFSDSRPPRGVMPPRPDFGPRESWKDR